MSLLGLFIVTHFLDRGFRYGREKPSFQPTTVLSALVLDARASRPRTLNLIDNVPRQDIVLFFFGDCYHGKAPEGFKITAVSIGERRVILMMVRLFWYSVTATKGLDLELESVVLDQIRRLHGLAG